jgi:hypothetical protein
MRPRDRPGSCGNEALDPQRSPVVGAPQLDPAFLRLPWRERPSATEAGEVSDALALHVDGDRHRVDRVLRLGHQVPRCLDDAAVGQTSSGEQLLKSLAPERCRARHRHHLRSHVGMMTPHRDARQATWLNDAGSE